MNFRTSAAAKTIQFAATSHETENLCLIRTEDLLPDPLNDSIYSEHPEDDEALYQDVLQNGILQPLLVRPDRDLPFTYRIIAGHRRYQAGCRAGSSDFPCLIKPVTSKEDFLAARVALISTNTKSRNKTPSETAREIELLTDTLKELKKVNPARWQQLATEATGKKEVETMREIVAAQTGLSERQVANYITVNRNLRAKDKEAFQNGKITLHEATERATKQVLAKKANKQEPKKLGMTDQEAGEFFLRLMGKSAQFFLFQAAVWGALTGGLLRAVSDESVRQKRGGASNDFSHHFQQRGLDIQKGNRPWQLYSWTVIANGLDDVFRKPSYRQAYLAIQAKIDKLFE